MLNRNLRYTLRSNLRPPPLGRCAACGATRSLTSSSVAAAALIVCCVFSTYREIQVRLTGCDLLTAPDSRPVQSLSVVVAVAEALSNGIDFKPVDAKLAVWDPSNHSAAEAAASGRQPALRSAPTVTLKIPDAKALLPLHVVMMVWGESLGRHVMACLASPTPSWHSCSDLHTTTPRCLSDSCWFCTLIAAQRGHQIFTRCCPNVMGPLWPPACLSLVCLGSCPQERLCGQPPHP